MLEDENCRARQLSTELLCSCTTVLVAFISHHTTCENLAKYWCSSLSLWNLYTAGDRWYIFALLTHLVSTFPYNTGWLETLVSFFFPLLNLCSGWGCQLQNDSLWHHFSWFPFLFFISSINTSRAPLRAAFVNIYSDATLAHEQRSKTNYCTPQGFTKVFPLITDPMFVMFQSLTMYWPHSTSACQLPNNSPMLASLQNYNV